MLEKDLKITRSQFLEGKTSLTDEDIISLLDLQPEKESRTDIKSYTDKNYSDFENDDASLQRLTENLINNSDYLLYRGSYIAKSKLLYEQSVTLCNEIPSLVIGQEIKESFYLLPYGYAKDNNQKLKKFADALDENAFTDIKRLYGTNIKNTYKKSKEQGKNVFYIISATDLSLSQSRGKLGFLINNDVKQGRDPSGKYYLYSENESSLIYLEVDKDGFFREERNFDLKKLRSVISNRPFSMRGQANTALTGTFNTLNDTNESVNTFFNSLLLRGEVEMIRSHKELQKYDSKYLNCLEALKQITNQTQSELLQNSNRLFIQSEIESEFYKDLIKEKKRNVALIDKTQGDKSMPSEKKELNISEEEAVRIQLAREIRQNMPNLSDGERAAALAILEAGAASMKMTLRDYVQTTFPHGVFGDFDKAQNAAQQQGVEINGAVSVSGFGANARAVIYASKTADFSTWCHELSHIWQVQLTGELKVNAEKVFQVQNGNWQESTYTFADGHTDTSAEAFAYGFEDFLKHKAGEMAAEDKKAIFEKFADYMSRTYNGVKENIKVNEDIAKVYEQFVQLDDNILAEAEKAVRMEKDLYDSKKNINALLNSPDLRSSKKVSKTLGYVSPQFSRLAKQYGYDIEGFRHTIDNFFINHANNRHSTARTETARGNVAITNDDILNIAKVYESPDYIIFGTKTKTGNPAIVYAKNMGNATVFVEDVRSGKKELAAETLYKKSGAIDVSSKKEVPELYAHSDPESISIVDVKKEFVNHIANGELIFQAAYHGSGASFDHFDTEHYGLSGEGSMSFGWGTYLTESEAIARDYAGRQNGIGKKLDSLLKKYPDLYSHITPIYNHMSLGDSFEEAKKNYVGYLRENHIPGIRKITKSIEELKAEDFAELFKKDRNLYTVSIPDGKYLSWNNDVPEATKTEIAEKLHSHLVESDPESYSGNAANYLRQELESLFESEMDGQRFYGSLADYLGSERQASEFLKESGSNGISYPAGTIYGNGNGATNYVIFNDDDIEIKEHLQFQTRTTEQKERKKIEIQTYKFQNGETIDEILSKQTSWATDAECLDNMIDNSLREVADFADEKENELLKKISIAKNNPEVDLKLLAVQTDAAARYMAAKHYDYRLADVGNRPFSKDFINPYAQDDFPYELPSWIKNHLEEYPNQNEPEHTSEEEKAYQEWEEMLDDNQREENDSNGQLSKFDSELSEYIAGKLPKNHIFELGFPGEILQNCGFPKEQRIELSGSHLEYKSKLKRHPFDLGEIKGLDVALQNPVAVFAYGDKTKSQNIIVNIEKEGKNFLTGIHFNQKNRGYEVSDIRTLYPKENIEWLNWINQGKMIYGNKEKLQALIAQQRMNVAEVNSQVVQSPLHEHCLESVKNILQKFGDVKEIYTDGHLFYEEIREQSKIEQKFFAYYTEKGNIDARELSSLEAEEFYNALKHNDITKIDEYKNNDFHEISELADEIYLEHFKNSVSTEEKYVIESLSEIGNAIKNDSAIILKSPTFGDVTFSKGVFGDLSKKNNGGYGINHIVEGRYVKDNLSKQDIASLLYLIKNTVETTEVDKDDSKSRQNIIKDGIWVTIRKDFDGIKQNWVVTGFAENDGNGQITKEAADAIKAVNAQYGYAPEHLFVSEQVGAVIASVNTIAQNILKSNDIERIKNFKSVYANTKFLSQIEKGLLIDNQSQLMSRGKQEKSLDSETNISQNTEKSINYHGLTLTKKDNNLSGLTPSGKPSVAEDISDKTHTPSTYININLEAVTNGLPDSHLKSSNLSFIQKEKNSQYYKDIIRQKERNLAQDTTKTKGEDRTMEKEKIEIQTYKFQNGETIDEILSKQTSWATDEEFLDNMIDNSLREVADFADEKENELLKKISIAKNNPEVDLKLLAVQTDAAARYMAAKHYDYRLADVGNRPFSKDFINPYAQDDFPYELPSWIKNHLEEYPNQNEPEHTSEEEKAYQEWEEMLEDNQREENIISHNVLKTKDSEKNISNTQREENSYLNSEELKSSLKKALNEIAKPLEVIPFTRENYNLLFPHSHIISPIENVKLGEHQFEKLDIKERQHILKAVHDTVATPDIIINEKRKTVFDDEKEAHVYAKAFKIDGKNKAVQSVVVSIEDENVSISTHLREINNVVNKIKMPEQLIFASTEIGQMVERLTGKQLGTVNPTRENEIFAPPVTTIPQNTENSINYHGLTLTKKDNNLIEPAYDVLLISGIDDKTDSKLIEMLDNTAKWDQYCVLNKSENYIPAIAAEIVEKEKEIKNENVNKSFIQKVQDLKAKVSKSLKKNVAVGVALTSVLSANPNLFAQEKPVKLPSEQTILKEAAKEKENLLKIYKDKSPEELLKLLLEANEEKTAAKIQASNLEKSVKELEVKNTKLEFYKENYKTAKIQASNLEKSVKELEVKNTKLELYKEHYKTKSATQESFYDEMKKTQDMYESLKRSSQQDHDILYKHAKIVVNGQERVCHTGLVDGFKNCVTRLDKSLKLNKELVKENNELRKIINQSNKNERNGVSY